MFCTDALSEFRVLPLQTRKQMFCTDALSEFRVLPLQTRKQMFCTDMPCQSHLANAVGQALQYVYVHALPEPFGKRFGAGSLVCLCTSCMGCRVYTLNSWHAWGLALLIKGA